MPNNAQDQRPSAEHLKQFIPFIPLATRYVAKNVSAHEVDDIIQDSLVRILAAQSSSVIQHPKAYLMMVVRTVIIDYLRHSSSIHLRDHCELTDSNHPVDAINPCRVLIGKQDFAQFTARFNALPSRTREILFAVRVEGLAMKAAAERFGVCVSTVEKQVARALARLADLSD